MVYKLNASSECASIHIRVLWESYTRVAFYISAIKNKITLSFLEIFPVLILQVYTLKFDKTLNLHDIVEQLFIEEYNLKDYPNYTECIRIRDLNPQMF